MTSSSGGHARTGFPQKALWSPPPWGIFIRASQ
jgi:hypothetical protein